MSEDVDDRRQPGASEDAEHEEGYTGAAVVLIEDVSVPVSVMLRGVFQPIDGHYHWYGRLSANEQLDELVAGKRTEVLLRTPVGEGRGALADQDVWGRYRIDGQGRPPFPLELDVSEETS
ncbi:DUF4873 domain-containing protein [Pseudonocardia eucalypti]|uniref:DUF4873 domain-containing protein n=1 Tax=Pseudonocardia eucalypti TaxID=648755 RepID=A0ABP9QE14_9PSEU|nr:hypothetical protein [Pseudonocardia eucalypti]